jgi:hypothetical protein
MLFSSSTLISLLALIGLTASQVIITVTNTIIINPIPQFYTKAQPLTLLQVTALTVTPKTTSTVEIGGFEALILINRGLESPYIIQNPLVSQPPLGP